MWYTLAKKKKPSSHSGVMIALTIPKKIAKQLSLDDSQVPENDDPELDSELHITLCILGEATDLKPRQKELDKVLEDFAVRNKPCEINVGGSGMFANDKDSDGVMIALVDSSDLTELRSDLINVLKNNNFEPDTTHGYTPHISLAFISDTKSAELQLLPKLNFTCHKLSVSWADKVTDFSFKK